MRHTDSLRPPRQTAPEELSHARVRAPHVVVNTCPVVPPDDVAKLLRPFRRRGVGRIRDVGLGLGLSIVAATRISRTRLRPRMDPVPRLGAVAKGPEPAPGPASRSRHCRHLRPWPRYSQ